MKLSFKSTFEAGGQKIKILHDSFLCTYRHSSIYPVNVGTHKKTRSKQKPRKSRLLSSTKGEENRIEL